MCDGQALSVHLPRPDEEKKRANEEDVPAVDGVHYFWHRRPADLMFINVTRFADMSPWPNDSERLSMFGWKFEEVK